MGTEIKRSNSAMSRFPSTATADDRRTRARINGYLIWMTDTFRYKPE